MYPFRPKAEAFDNAVDVVELLLVSTDQAVGVKTGGSPVGGPELCV